MDADGLDWTTGMIELNRLSAAAAKQGRESSREFLPTLGTRALPPLIEIERNVVSRPDLAEMMSAAFAEAIRPGIDGWVDDAVALNGSIWGFDPAAIIIPVRLWHGELTRSSHPRTRAGWRPASRPPS